MKSAQIAMWAAKPSNNANAPQFYGTVQIPAALVAELYSLMQQGQGMETNREGEQVFRLRHSTWRRDGQNNGPIASGEIKSPGEEAAYQAGKGGGQSYAPAPTAAGPLGHGGPVAAAPARPPARPPAQPPAQQPLSEPQWTGSGWVAWDGAQWRPSAPPVPPAHAAQTAPPMAAPQQFAPPAAAPPAAAPPAGWGGPQQPAPPMAAAPAPGGWRAQPGQAPTAW